MIKKIKTQGSIAGTVIFVLLFISLILTVFVYEMSRPKILNKQELRHIGAVLLETPRIFSDFELTDQAGKPFNLANVQDKWSLIFFGFTHCPDICPTTMAMLSTFYEQLDKKEKDKVQIVLISLDPERDTTEKLSDYVSYFNPVFTGATGNKYVLLKMATELNVAFSKVELDNGDYTIDHSGNIVLINPYGHYHGFFRPAFETDQVHAAFEPGRIHEALRSIMAVFPD